MGVVLDIEVHHGVVIEAPTSEPLRVVSASKSITTWPLSSVNRLYVRGDAVGRGKLTVTDGDHTWTYKFRVSPDIDGQTDASALSVERGRSLVLEPPDATAVEHVRAGDDALVALEQLFGRVHLVGRAVGETDVLIERKSGPVQVYAVDVTPSAPAPAGEQDVLEMALNHSLVIETPRPLDAARIADSAVGAYAQVYPNLAVVSGRSPGTTDLVLLLHGVAPPKYYRVTVGGPVAHDPGAKVVRVGATVTWPARPGGLVWVGGLDVAVATLIDGTVTVRGLQPGATDVVELYADGAPVFTEIEVVP